MLTLKQLQLHHSGRFRFNDFKVINPERCLLVWMRVFTPQSVVMGVRRKADCWLNTVMKQWERRRWARGYVDREMEGKKTARGQLFKQSDRGGVFDAKLMIVAHGCLIKWYALLGITRTEKLQINIFKSFITLSSSIMVDRFVSDRLGRQIVLWLERQRVLWSSGKMVSMTKTPNHCMFKECCQLSHHLITVTVMSISYMSSFTLESAFSCI